METLATIVVILIVIYLASKDRSYNEIQTQVPYKLPPEDNKVTLPTTRVWESKGSLRKVIDYKTYITSPTWKNNPSRLATLQKDGNCCRMCGGDYNVQVHHITYESLGNEKPSHLVSLCQPCHEHTHKVAGKGAGTYPPIRKRNK